VSHMKKNTVTMLTATLSLLGAASIYGADVEIKTKADTDKPKVEAEVKTDGTNTRQYKEEARVGNFVRANQKASNIIGMEVRNRSDEKLGEVKDVVLDLQTGKIGYVVLGVGGTIFGAGEKLLAIPPSAFTPSESHGRLLILDATKGQITDAPGIASTNWPDPRQDMSDSPFLRSKNATGAAAESESGKAKLYTEPGKVETKVEKK
jgi:sporulation protein YlmC with PRC-barrel domain